MTVEPYTAFLTKRDGPGWYVGVPGLGVAALVSRLADAERVVRRRAAKLLKTTPDRVPIQMIVGDTCQVMGIQERSQQILEARRVAHRLEDKTRQETRKLACELASDGVSPRDIAVLCGVSLRRVEKLIR